MNEIDDSNGLYWTPLDSIGSGRRQYTGRSMEDQEDQEDQKDQKDEME